MSHLFPFFLEEKCLSLSLGRTLLCVCVCVHLQEPGRQSSWPESISRAGQHQATSNTVWCAQLYILKSIKSCECICEVGVHETLTDMKETVASSPSKSVWYKPFIVDTTGLRPKIHEGSSWAEAHWVYYFLEPSSTLPKWNKSYPPVHL